MAELATLQTGVPALVAALLGIPCDWRTQARPMHVSARAQLDWLGSNGIGSDERTTSDVDADGAPTDVDADIVAVVETVHGLREATLQVSVWSPRQTLGESARFYLERLRTRIRWSSSIASMKALGLALVRVEPIVQIDPDEDGRVVSGAAMDLRLAYGQSEADAAIPFIESARVTTQITNAADELLPDVVQIDATQPEES